MQTYFADFTSLDYYRRERIWWAFIQEVLRCWTKIIARAMNPNVNITVYGKRICWLYLHVYDDFATRDVHFSPKPRPDGDVKYVLNGYLNHNINRKQKKISLLNLVTNSFRNIRIEQKNSLPVLVWSHCQHFEKRTILFAGIVLTNRSILENPNLFLVRWTKNQKI